MTETSEERFRREAERCRKEAAQASSEPDKVAWLRMANDWIRLAEEATPKKRRPQARNHSTSDLVSDEKDQPFG